MLFVNLPFSEGQGKDHWDEIASPKHGNLTILPAEHNIELSPVLTNRPYAPKRGVIRLSGPATMSRHSGPLRYELLGMEESRS